MEVDFVNIKKLFSNDKLNKRKLAEFFDKKGFYIVLTLCVVVVIATAVFVTSRNMPSASVETDEKAVSSSKDSKLTLDASSKAVIPNTSAITTKDTSAKLVTDSAKGTTAKEADKSSNTASSDPKVATAPKAVQAPTVATKPIPADPNFTLPVFGQITFDFSKDKLTYSKTLDQWMTHNGVDIASDRGEKVKAVADSVVTDMKKDPRFGVTIILDHQNGYKTVYSNLADEEMVTMNQKLKQGDVIGSVGNSALFESAEAPHLHFEVWKNNLSVDPKLFLPKK